MNLEIDECERQAILLALAKLSLSRPGWHPACLSPIAEKLNGLELYEAFRSYGPDPQYAAEPQVDGKSVRFELDEEHVAKFLKAADSFA